MPMERLYDSVDRPAASNSLLKYGSFSGVRLQVDKAEQP